MEDFCLEPARIERVLDMILQWKLAHFEEATRWFGDRVQGIFLTDDWGTQQGTFVRQQLFEDFFAKRYATLFGAVHDHGWHTAGTAGLGMAIRHVPRMLDICAVSGSLGVN